MADAARKLMTVAEFLEWDDGTDTRYELVYGQPVAMAYPTDAHGTIAANIIFAAARRLTPPCRVVSQAGIVRAEYNDRYYQADVAITCTPATPGGRPVPQPVVVFEVLSPSTTARDVAIKLPDYQEISSIQEIVIVSTQNRRVEHWRRDGSRWVALAIVGEGTIDLACLGISMPLPELYANVALEQGEPA